MFPSAKGTLRWPENVRAQWTLAVAETDVDWMTTKSCRKAVGNHLRNEVGLAAAQEQLGHASPDVTDKHYVERVLERTDRSSSPGAFGESSH